MKLTEKKAKEWVSLKNPDCDSSEHWFYQQANAYLAGWAECENTILEMLRQNIMEDEALGWADWIESKLKE